MDLRGVRGLKGVVWRQGGVGVGLFGGVGVMGMVLGGGAGDGAGGVGREDFRGKVRGVGSDGKGRCKEEEERKGRKGEVKSEIGE